MRPTCSPAPLALLAAVILPLAVAPAARAQGVAPGTAPAAPPAAERVAPVPAAEGEPAGTADGGRVVDTDDGWVAPSTVTSGAPLTVGAAVERAARGNPDLTRAGLDIEIASQNAREARGGFDYVLDAMGRIDVSRGPSQIVPSELQTRVAPSASVGLSRRFEPGTQVRAAWDATYTDTSAVNVPGLPVPISFGGAELFQWGLSLTATQPLMRGYGRTVNLAAERVAEKRRDAAALARERRVSEIVLEVERGYWELAYGLHEREIRVNSVELARAEADDTAARIAAGQAPELAIFQVRQVVAARQEGVVMAELGVRQARDGLAVLLGERPGAFDAIALAESIADVDPVAEGRASDLDPAAAARLALEANPDLRTLREELAARELAVVVDETAVKPKLDAFASAGLVQVVTDAPSTASGMQQDVTVGRAGFAWSAGLNFLMPLGNDAAEARAQASRLSVEQLRVQQRLLEDRATTTARAAVRDARSALERLRITAVAEELAQKSLAAEQERFRVGVAIQKAVLDAQQVLEEAKVRRARATVDLVVAKARLDHVTGRLLLRHGLAVK